MSTVNCDFCNREKDWEDGKVWQCEECGKIFCLNCFVEAYSLSDYEDMVNVDNGNKILCPSCYGKRR